MNILVIDVGTSGMKGTVLDEAGNCVFMDGVPYQPAYLGDGIVEEDPADWLGALKKLCLEASKRARTDAIALTAQRSSVIPADAAGRPVFPAIMWQDTRNREICGRLKEREDEIRRICGTGVNTVFSGGKMAWLKEAEPSVYEKAAHLFVIPDYLIFCMTGEHVTDHTYGSRSMLMDIRTREWSDRLTEWFGIDRRKLGRLIRPGSTAGSILPSFAKETGLTAGIPVISCGGDQQCSAVGQGAYKEGTAAVTLGTGGYIVSPIGSVPEQISADHLCNASAVPGAYILESALLTCSAAVNWFLKETGKEGEYAFVGEALRKSPPGANGVIALPYFQGHGAPDWNSEARAVFCGLSLATTREDMLRALVEGICTDVRCSLKRMRIGISAASLSGGMSRTPEVCQLLSDVTGLIISCPDESDATTRGAWMSAAVSLGLVSGWDEAWERIRPAKSRIHTPREALRSLYDALEERTGRLYELSKAVQ